MSLKALARERLATFAGRETPAETLVKQKAVQASARKCFTVSIPSDETVKQPQPFAGVRPLDALKIAGRETPAETLVKQGWAAALASNWRDGLAHLATAPPPSGIQPRRWTQVVADALVLADTWAPQAMALGWRDVDLWGCNPDRSRRLDRDGLAMLLHGRPVLAMTDNAATIATPGGRTLSYYRAPLDGAALLWALR